MPGRLPGPLRGFGLLGVALTLAVALTGCSRGGAAAAGLDGDVGYAGTVVEPGYPLPAGNFTDTSGRPWTFAADGSKPVSLVFFGYTSCPDVCTAQLADLAAALRREDPGVRQKVQVVWITVDPRRDDARTIRTYLDRFDPTIVGLRASAETVAEAADHMGVALTGRDDPAHGEQIGHGAQIIGTTRSGLSVVWVPGTPVADLRSDIARLASSS